jgi:aquaporin Z
MKSGNRLVAELLGTFWLVFGGCGSAVLAAKVFMTERLTTINLGIGYVGVALAFGLTVLTMAYAIGHISGCHLNPAVTVGLCVARRFPVRDVVPYILVQVFGAILAAGTLMFIASGREGWSVDVRPDSPAAAGEFATNGYGKFSPGKFNLPACAMAEGVLTFMFLIIILGATDKRAPAGFAPLAIGLGLTLIHLIGIPITNTSVNPARSTGPALALLVAARDSIPEQIQQLWLFWVAPLGGAVLAGIVYPILAPEPRTTATDAAAPDIGGIRPWPGDSPASGAANPR